MARARLTTLGQLVECLNAFGPCPAIGLRLDLGLRWWTYERLYRESKKAAAVLSARGIRKGDRVMIQAPNCPEWVGCFLGLMLVGAVAVPVEHDAVTEVVDRIAEVVDPRLKLSLSDLEALFALEGDTAFEPLAEVAQADPAIIFFTSGTTSAPRGVMLTHGNIAAQVLRFRIWRPLARLLPARMMVMAPLSHAQGIVLGVAIPLFLGLSVIYTHSSHPGHLMRILRDNRVVVLSTLPRVLHLLGQAFLDQRYGSSGRTLREKLEPGRPWALRRHFIFTNMRRSVGYRFWLVLVGGAPLPEPDERFWRDSGCLLVQGYGLTETTAVISVNLPLLGRFGSVGRPLTHQDVRIGEDGEILVRGPNVMESYFGETARADGEMSDGFLRTGDIGYLDSRKRLYIVGRKKEVIITGEGFNVYAGDIESALNVAAGVRDSVVLGIERDGHTEVHAVLLLKAEASASTVVRQANQRLLSNQRVTSWSVWPEDDFPRGSLLKVKRRAVEDRIQRGSLNGAPQQATEPPSVEELLLIEDKRTRIQELARFVVHGRNRKVTDGSAAMLGDLGLTSLDTIELVSAIEKESGTFRSDAAVVEEMTLRDLQDLVSNPLSDRALRPRDRKSPPRWAEASILNWPRRIFNPLVLGFLAKFRAETEVIGLENLAGVSGPVILMGVGHEHAFDVLLINSALPPRMHRKMAIVASRWVFTYILEPEPEMRWRDRLMVGLGFYFLVPLFFPMALSAPFGRARDGLMDAGRLIDKGFSLISFQGRGVGVVASQCGIPVIPVHLSGNDDIDFSLRKARARVTIEFGRLMAGGAADFDNE
jgi:long-chain acyl-CoA synthetase